MADLPVPSGVPGIVQREAMAGNPLTVPLTPEDMWRQAVQARRGFESSPSGPADAARRTLQLPEGFGKPGDVGAPVGKGYETFGSVQVLDKNGRRVAIGAEWFNGGGPDEHAEARTLRALDRQNVGRVDGGKLIVVVDQEPCTHCAPKLKAWAERAGAAEVEVYVPERESLRSPGKTVSPKTAARTSLMDNGKTVRMKKLWVHKVPRRPALPHAPGGSRSARSAIKASLLGLVVGLSLGWAKDAMAAEMKEAMRAMPKPGIDKQGAADYFRNPKTAQGIRFIDLLSTESRAFAGALADHHARLVGQTNIEMAIIAVSGVGLEERIAFLDQITDEHHRYQDELLVVERNLDAALDIESQCLDNANSAEQLAALVDRALVADHLLKSGFEFDEIVQLHVRLKSYASTTRATFVRLRQLRTDVARFIDESGQLGHAANKLRWSIVGTAIAEHLRP